MKLVRTFFKSELLRGSGMYLVASSISSSIPFLLLPVLTRYLTPTEYGEVGMFTVLLSFLGAVCGLSSHGAANRKYFDYKEEKQKLADYVFMCIVIMLVSSTSVFIIILTISPLLSDILGLPVDWLLLSVPVAMLNFLLRLRLGQWQVDKQPVKYGLFQIGQSIVNAGTSLLLVAVLYMGATGRIIGIVGSTLIFAVIAFLSLKNDELIRFSWRPKMAGDALRFSVPLVPHVLGLFLISSIDRIVITNELGLEEAGIYMVAIQISMAATLVLTAVNQAFVPWLFGKLELNSQLEKRNIVKVTYGYYLLLSIGVAIAFWIGDDVLKLMVDRKYYEAANLIGWIFLAKGLHGGYLMVTNYLFYAKRTGILSAITIGTGGLNVFLLFILVENFNLVGAVWALCISKFIQWLATWILANQAVKMPWLKA